ncbi:hypothetical protein NQZ68_031361 [Dissostichus eleginoides]|nr:hypothetical protein NQZ68_031361 [Dissostichus eleginoides]
MGYGDPPCPVLKREQSPSPPPLSPMPSDMDTKTEEKPPSLLHHRQEKETDLIVKDGMVNERQQEAGVDTATEVERYCSTPSSIHSEQNPSGTSLQDVVNRFSEKLETIGPIEKDIPLVFTAVNVSKKERPQCPSTSQNLQFQADAHLTEIITTVLHTGSASDYNLSELFNRHDSKEPKSPNTRSRRRQEVRSFTSQVLFFTQVSFFITEVVIFPQVCFFTSQVWFFTNQVSIFTQVSFFIIQVWFFTTQVSIFTQVCFIIT